MLLKLKTAKKKPNGQIYFSRPRKKIKSQIRVIWPHKGQNGNPGVQVLFVQNTKSILACQYTAPSIEIINNTMLFIISMAPSRLGSIVGYSIRRFQI